MLIYGLTKQFILVAWLVGWPISRHGLAGEVGYICGARRLAAQVQSLCRPTGTGGRVISRYTINTRSRERSRELHNSGVGLRQ